MTFFATGRRKTPLTIFAAVLTVQALFLYSPFFTFDSFEFLDSCDKVSHYEKTIFYPDGSGGALRQS